MAGGNQRIRDRLYVLLLGAVLAALAWVWGFETPPPDLMDDLAMAAGLRPPTGPFGHLWHAVAAQEKRGMTAWWAVGRLS